MTGATVFLTRTSGERIRLERDFIESVTRAVGSERTIVRYKGKCIYVLESVKNVLRKI